MPLYLGGGPWRPLRDEERARTEAPPHLTAAAPSGAGEAAGSRGGRSRGQPPPAPRAAAGSSGKGSAEHSRGAPAERRHSHRLAGPPPPRA